jgi:hypothetical protein
MQPSKFSVGEIFQALTSKGVDRDIMRRFREHSLQNGSKMEALIK